MKEVCLVVPTIREKSFSDFVERWAKLNLFDVVDLLVVEDNPTKTIETNPNYVAYHYCWKDIEKTLEKDSWIIPRRSDTVRSFGYLMAYRFGYKYIMTLDDDCYPPTEADGLIYETGEAFVEEHLKHLRKKTRWFNTLDNVKPRGIPFHNVGTWQRNIINHGLWTNVLDYDAPTQLVNPAPEKFAFDNRVVPLCFYFPMCGMNVAWKREATVLMYHLLMGQAYFLLINGVGVQNLEEANLDKLPFDRFGDIWCGIIAKKICDSMSYTMSTGMPYVRHERASNPFANLKKEANGIEVNEKFWEYIDFANVGQGDLTHAYYKMGEHVEMFDDFAEYKSYFAKLGKAMKIWSELVQKSDV